MSEAMFEDISEVPNICESIHKNRSRLPLHFKQIPCYNDSDRWSKPEACLKT